MEEKYGWEKLLSDSFFQHIDIGSEPSLNDVERLLKVICQELYLESISISAEDVGLMVSELDTRKEVVGYQSLKLRTWLENFKNDPANAFLAGKKHMEQLQKFASDENFRSYTLIRVSKAHETESML